MHIEISFELLTKVVAYSYVELDDMEWEEAEGRIVSDRIEDMFERFRTLIGRKEKVLITDFGFRYETTGTGSNICALCGDEMESNSGELEEHFHMSHEEFLDMYAEYESELEMLVVPISEIVAPETEEPTAQEPLKTQEPLCPLAQNNTC